METSQATDTRCQRCGTLAECAGKPYLRGLYCPQCIAYYEKERKKRARKLSQSLHNEAMQSLGLTSYRNASGKLCWE